jgi:hypothetical protein
MNPGIIASSYIKGSYILNQFTGSYAAYSLRKLSGTYTGPCMKIIRDKDNAELDINFVGGKLDTGSISNFIGTQTNIWRYSEPATDPGEGTRSNITFSTFNSGSITSGSTSITFDGTTVLNNQGKTVTSQFLGVVYPSSPFVGAGTYTMYSVAKRTDNGILKFGPNDTASDYIHLMATQPGTNFNSQSLDNNFYLCKSEYTVTGTGGTNWGIRKTTTQTSNTVEVTGILLISGSTNYNFEQYVEAYIKTVGFVGGRARVRTWYDQSENNRHMQANTVTAQPAVVEVNAFGVQYFPTASNANNAVGINQSIYSTTGFTMQNFLSASVLNDFQVYNHSNPGSQTLYTGYTTNPSVRYYGLFQSGSTSTSIGSGVGSPIYSINTSIISGSTRGQGWNQIYPSGPATYDAKLISATNLQLGFNIYLTKPLNAVASLNNLIEKIMYTGSVSSFTSSLSTKINSYYNLY